MSNELRNSYDLNNLSRIELMNIIADVYNFLLKLNEVSGQKQAIEKQMDKINERRNWIESHLNTERNCVEKLPHFISGGKVAGNIFRSAGIAGGIYLIVSYFHLLMILEKNGGHFNISEVLVSGWIFLVLFLIVFIIMFFVSIIRTHEHYKKAIECYNSNCNIATMENIQLEQKEQQLGEKMTQLDHLLAQLPGEYVEGFQFSQIIPQYYRNCKDLNYIYRYLEHCRASNWKEAVNLYESERNKNAGKSKYVMY
ncbi:MAG: hypothetical protein NC089_02885 [Bacteroides sp.]|nr:hypothetical protein [Bacteroides sp.]MCM1550532.1 hypothetical protein [Clostridium sp.]